MHHYHTYTNITMLYSSNQRILCSGKIQETIGRQAESSFTDSEKYVRLYIDKQD